MSDKIIENLSSNYLTFEEAATFLNLKPSRLRYAIRHNQVPFIKFQQSIKFDRDELINWMKSMSIEPAKSSRQIMAEIRDLKKQQRNYR